MFRRHRAISRPIHATPKAAIVTRADRLEERLQAIDLCRSAAETTWSREFLDRLHAFIFNQIELERTA